jgi:ADP-ribose pyrophosphatase
MVSMSEISITSRETHYHGKVFNVEKVTFSMPNGKQPTYDLVVHPGAAVVLPIDSEGNILFVRQWRLGAEQALLELPAGTLNAQEAPIECALREVREETGMAAAQLTQIGSFYLTPGYSNEHLVIFLAQGLSPAPLQQDEDELIGLVRIPIQDAYQMAADGRIVDGKTLASLLLAEGLIR